MGWSSDLELAFLFFHFLFDHALQTVQFHHQSSKVLLLLLLLLSGYLLLAF